MCGCDLALVRLHGIADQLGKVVEGFSQLEGANRIRSNDLTVAIDVRSGTEETCKLR